MTSYYWTLESWGEYYPPDNADEIIEEANTAIDRYIANNPDADTDEISNYSERLWYEYCNGYGFGNNREPKLRMTREERIESIVAYVGTIIDDIVGMSEDEIRHLIENDIELMDEEAAAFTREYLDEIVQEAITEI